MQASFIPSFAHSFRSESHKSALAGWEVLNHTFSSGRYIVKGTDRFVWFLACSFLHSFDSL